MHAVESVMKKKKKEEEEQGAVMGTSCKK